MGSVRNGCEHLEGHMSRMYLTRPVHLGQMGLAQGPLHLRISGVSS